MQQCFIHPIHRERYWKCDNYFLSDILFHSNNLLLLYSPFIDIFLNQSLIIDYLYFNFKISPSQYVIYIDLRSLNSIKSSFKIHLNMEYLSHPTQILYKTYPWFNRFFYLHNRTESSFDVISVWHIQQNTSSTNDEIICYNFTTTPIDETFGLSYNISNTCPSDKCLADKNENRICIGSTPCIYVGDETLLCRVEQLQMNDYFNVNRKLLFTDLIIITTDNQTNTSHKFSQNLLKPCIAQRLIIIIIHGRLEIPSFNSTSLNCGTDWTVEVEFWHGNCSTFEMVYNNDLERMYKTNQITLGNFYTGEKDRLNISCISNYSIPSITKKYVFDLIIVCLLVIVTCLMCIVGWYYQKNPRYK